MQLACPSCGDHRSLMIAHVAVIAAIAAFVRVCPSAATLP